MQFRRVLLSAVAAATVVLSFGIFAVPAGAVDASTTTVTDNAASVSTGGTLIFTATVTGTSTPDGTVAWSGSVCTSTTDLTAGVATCSISDAQASTAYTVTANFTDTDGLFSDSSGSDGPKSPNPANSATNVVDNAGSIATGGTLVFTATVSGPGDTPAGNVAWTGSCTATVPLSGGVAACSISNAQASAAYSVTASFTDSDGNYFGSNGSDGPVSPSTANQAALTVSSTSGTYGSATTLTTNGGSGTGVVSYSVINGTASGCTISSGQLTSTSAGTCVVTAIKAGDANFNSASSGPTAVTFAKANSSTHVVDNASSINTGGTLVFTATVTGPAGTPEGSFTWSGSPCSTSTVSIAGDTCSISNAQAGTGYTVTATFTDSDGNYNGSNASHGPVSPGTAAQAAPTR